MDIIHLLPDSVANQIAAGEVVQRPASVVKELLENSIDAHATEIQVVLREAGRELIQVIDNGIGMSPADARMAFEKHATRLPTSSTFIRWVSEAKPWRRWLLSPRSNCVHVAATMRLAS